MQGDFYILSVMAAIFIGFPIYFLPSYIGGKKMHPKRRQILLWNVLLGWTVFGWAVLLILASKKNSES